LEHDKKSYAEKLVAGLKYAKKYHWHVVDMKKLEK